MGVKKHTNTWLESVTGEDGDDCVFCFIQTFWPDSDNFFSQHILFDTRETVQIHHHHCGKSSKLILTNGGSVILHDKW